MTISHVKIRIGLSCLVLLASLPATAEDLGASGRASSVRAEVRQALSEEGRVRVLVALEDPSNGVEASGLRVVVTRRGPPAPDTFRTIQDRALSRVSDTSVRLLHRYSFSPVLALELSDEDSLRLLEANPEVVDVTPDPEGSGALLESVPLIGADRVFDAGFDGAGRVAAVLDTGVDTDHPDLRDAVIDQHRTIHDGGAETDAEDDHGHGTNVTGIIVSRGLVAPRGVAPGGGIVAVKVLDSQNRGFLSDWAAGVEYVVQLHDADNGIHVDAINMSLVSDASYTEVCDGSFTAFASACEAALSRGIAVFGASGNRGTLTSMTSPACLSKVWSVGSVADTLPYAISPFTSRNELLDLLAPGAVITSTGRGGGTSTFQGTSQACPHAVGAALLLREIQPTISGESIRDLLRATGLMVDDPDTGLVFPRIDVQAAADILGVDGDCNQNGRPDYLEIHVDGTSADSDANGIPDECEGPVFYRGDANTDGDIDISDAVFDLQSLFSSGPSSSCLETMDMNNDGLIDISDPIYLLNFLFLGGDRLPKPGPPPGPCGRDSQDSGSGTFLGCDRYDRCGSTVGG